MNYGQEVRLWNERLVLREKLSSVEAWHGKETVVMSIFATSMTLYKLAVAFNVGVDREVFGYNVVEVCGSHLMSRQGCG